MTPLHHLHQPQTPGTGLEFASYDWLTTGIEVSIKGSIPEAGLKGQLGIVKNINNNTAAIYLLQEERVVSVNCDYLVATPPTPGDRIKVTVGDLREQTGIVVSVDGNDGVVQFDSLASEVKIVPLSYLCRFVE